MTLTKKVFQMVADVVATMPAETRLELGEKFAAQFEASNPHFDRKKFVIACIGDLSDVRI